MRSNTSNESLGSGSEEMATEPECLKYTILITAESSLQFFYAYPCSFYLLDYRTSVMNSQKKWAFWRADNSIGTFFMQIDPKDLIQPQAYDLRLAISNYGLFTINETVPAGSDKPQTKLSQTLSSVRKLSRNARMFGVFRMS